MYTLYSTVQYTILYQVDMISYGSGALEVRVQSSLSTVIKIFVRSGSTEYTPLLEFTLVRKLHFAISLSAVTLFKYSI